MLSHHWIYFQCPIKSSALCPLTCYSVGITLTVTNTAAHAQIRYEQWLAVAGLPSRTRDYGIRRLGSRPPVETEPQNFPAAGNTYSGNWKIVSGATGEVLYTFGGIGNSQSDANRVARDWAERTGFDDTIEVYPIMR
jgi:hypothetical protein